MATFDIKRLNTLDRIVVGASAIAVICLFLPWWGASASAGGISYSASVSGFSTSWGWLGGILVVAAGVYLLLVRSAVDVSKMPVTPAAVVLGLSALGTLIVIIRWATIPRGGVSGFGGGYSYGARFGLWITLIVAIAQVVCAVMLFRSSGEALPWKKEAPGA